MIPPSGTLTFLFTDIEGSTQLWQTHPAAMPGALARHHAILKEAIAAHNGYVFQIVGDAFCAAFSLAADALASALAAQRALCDTPWGETGPLRVRMALHSGPAQVQPGDFTAGEYQSSLTLSRAARLLSAAHGGQTVLSRSVYEQLVEQAPEGLEIRDLGQHRLKDLVRPEHIYQVAAPGSLTADFPPLRSLERHAHNLPIQLTRFIGRARELDEIAALLAGQRLVTLIGPGGTGKTRLALQAAASQVETSNDGVFFVSLAAVTDPALVLLTIAETLGIRERPGLDLQASLTAYLQPRDLLLVVDNFEQLLPAAPRLNELRTAAPRLRLMVTSRSPLQVYGEVTYNVRPLSLPAPDRELALGQLAENESVALFLERARAAQPGFALSTGNAIAVVQICRQLDGLPLALELVAARLRLLTPQKIVAQLERRLNLLTGGARDLPARHQTLRAAIDWSHDLLDEGEQRLFRRLGVFAGGCSLAAAEMVSGSSGPLSTLDSLAALVDKSLLDQREGVDGEPRFTMLATIREYALEKLAASGEAEALRRQHGAYFAALATYDELQAGASQAEAWFAHTEADHDNFRAMLQWSLEANEARLALGACVVLRWFWENSGGFEREGRDWFRAVLALPVYVPVDLRVDALQSAATLAWQQNDFDEARSLIGQALTLAASAGQRPVLGWLYVTLSRINLEQGDADQALAAAEQAVQLSQAVNDADTQAAALAHLGASLRAKGAHAAAQPVFEAMLALTPAAGPTVFSAMAWRHLGEIGQAQGDYDRAWACMRASLKDVQAIVSRNGVARTLGTMAALLGTQPGRDRDDRLRAVRVWGAIAAFHEATGRSYSQPHRSRLEAHLGAVRASLGPAAWDAAWSEGRQLSLDQAAAIFGELETIESQTSSGGPSGSLAGN
jgi:predicted ATPase/class 3 adenylate cyclase